MKARTAIAMAAALCACSATPSRAAESPNPPRHLAPYGMDWLAYVAPEDLPPTRYAVCLVDSGVAVTPDTPPSSATGPILDRLATDGGPGEPQGDAPEQLHGTRMAAAISAPANGWGTIGAVPWVPVVSVRAMVEGETSFRDNGWARGISLCTGRRQEFAVAAINASLGRFGNLPEDEDAVLTDYVARARNYGLSVVAAAGNRASQNIDVPARLNDVLAVAAGSAAGALCGYASYAASVDVTAPACPVDVGDPLTGAPSLTENGGSSTATAVTSALIAALRTLRPDATLADVEGWIIDSAAVVGDRRILDGEAAARAAGLGEIIARARARMTSLRLPELAPPQQGGVLTTDGSPRPPAELGVGVGVTRRLRAPRNARAWWREGKLTVAVADRPPGARLSVRARWLGDFRVARPSVARSRLARRVVLKLRVRPQVVVVRFEGGHLKGRRSPGVTLTARRGGRYR